MSFSRVQALVVRTRPEKIEDLYLSDEELQHLHAENMEWWCSDSEISAFIADTNRVNKLLSELATAALLLGMNMRNLLDNNTGGGNNNSNNERRIIFMSSCEGCNTPYDNGGCSHGAVPPLRVPLGNDDLTRFLHTATVTVAILSHLLASSKGKDDDDADKIVRLALDREPEFGMTSRAVLKKVEHQHEIGMPCVLPSLLGLVDNCSFAFPKLVHKTVGLMALIICRYPARSLGCLDADEFARVISHKFLSSTFALLHNSGCVVEERFGIVGFLNVLPALYHFGPWRIVHRSADFPFFLAGFVSSLINVCHSATGPDAEEREDSAIDLNECPELSSAKVLIKPLLLVDDEAEDTQEREWRLEVLRDRPMSFLVASSLEVLGWWAYKGVDLSQARIPGDPGEIITVQSAMAEYLPRIRQLVARTPKLAYIEPLAEALARGETSATTLAPLVKCSSQSLLYGPLMDANRRCGYCREPQNRDRDTGGDLLRCGGGCGEMEQYCCKEHQVAHWKHHKAFCKANKRAY